VPAIIGGAVLVIGLAALRVRIWGVLLPGLGRRRRASGPGEA